MKIKTPKRDLLTPPKRLLEALIVFACVYIASLVAYLAVPTPAAAATSSTINFQARLETNSGAITADGDYNVEFKLYDASSSSGSSQGSCSGDAHCLWVEPRTGADQVHVANGYLTVNLGSVTAFGSINWNQQLWLTMNIGGTGSTPSWDGEMNPRLLLTATPYAFQAGALGATNGSNVATLSFTAPTANETILLPTTTGTQNVCYQNDTNCGFAPSTGGTGYVQLQGSTPGTVQTGNFNISGTGILTSLQSASGATGTVLTVQAGASTSGTNTGANLLLQGGAGASTGASGSVIVKSNTNDSTTAFQVQNASGTSLLTIDTSNGKVTVNASGDSASATVATINAPANFTGNWFDLQENGTSYLQLQSYLNNTYYEPRFYAGGGNPNGQAIWFGNSNGALRVLPYNDGNTYFQTSQGNWEFSGLNGTQGYSETFNFSYNEFTGRLGIGMMPGTLDGALSIADSVAPPAGPGSADLEIGYSGTYSWIQGYQSNPLELNPLANSVIIGSTTAVVAQTIQIGNNATSGSTNTVSIGNLLSTSTTTIQGGSGNINLNTNQAGAGVVVKTVTTNSTTAFQVQNASGAGLLTVDTSTTVNLVTDGDFGPGDGTTGWAASSGATLSAVTAQAWQGSQSLQVATTTTANDGAKYTYTPSASTAYTLSLYAKVSSGSITDVNIGRQDNTTNGQVDCLTGQTLTTTWTRFTCTYTTNATINTAFIYIKKTGTSAETFFIDGVQLESGTAATAFDPGGRVQLEGIINSPVVVQNRSDSRYAFQVVNTSGTSDLTIDTSNGKVGIGTNAPDATVQIVGPTTSANFPHSLDLTDSTAFAQGVGGGIGFSGHIDGTVGTFSFADIQGVKENGTSGNDAGSLIFRTRSNGSSGLSQVASLSSGGAALFQNSSNSTAAFQIQNSSNAALFKVDTTNTAIVLGNDGAPSTLTVRGGAATGTDAAGANLTFDASNGTGSGGSGDLIFRTASPSGSSVTFDNASSGNTGGMNTNFSFSLTIGGHTNMLLVVNTAGTNSHCASSVIFDPSGSNQSLTSLISTGSDQCATLWYLKLGTPTAGTYTIKVNLPVSDDMAAGAETFYNVDQTTPFGSTTQNNNAGATGMSVSVTTTNTRQMVVDGAAAYNHTITQSAGQTLNSTNQESFGLIAEGSSRQAATGGTVTMGWTSTSGTNIWGLTAAVINPITAAGSSADALTDRLHISSTGNIGINQSTPGYTLDVNGTGNFSTAVQAPLLQAPAAAALTITGNAASTWSTTAGDLTIQGGSGNVSLGTSTVLTASGSYTIQAGTAASTLTVGSSSMTGALTLGSSTAGQTIQIGHATVATGKTQTIQIGDAATGTGKDVITLGNTNGASSLTLQAGTGNFSLTGAAGTTYTIGAAGTTGQTTLGQSTASNTISIGAANTTTGNTQTINIGSGTGAGTGKALVTIGSLANASATTIQAGTGNINLNTNQTGAGVLVQTLTTNSTSAFKVQDASSDNILTVDSANRQVIITNANDTAVAGSELFTASFSFVSGGGWTGISGSGSSATATHTNGGGVATLSASPSMTITAGAVYKVTYTVSSMTGGSVTASVGGVSGSAVSSNSTETDYITTTTTGNLTFTPTNTFDGTVSSVSVKQMSNQTASVVLDDSTGTVAAEFRVSTTANGSLGIGYQSLQENVGTKNTAFGLQALSANTSGISNTGVGALALQNNTTGNLNTAIGLQGLKVNTSGNNNTSLGAFALNANSTGGSNTAIGYETLDSIVSGTGVTGLGALAGNSGSQSDFQTLSTITSATLLGRYAQATCSNCVILGGQGADQASVGIGTPNPTNFLSVEPVQYNTGTVSTTASSGSVTGSGTTFTATMVGSEIYIASNSTTTATYKGTVSTFTDATHITVSPNVSFTISGAHYYILYGGLQVTSSGTVYTQGTSTTQFQVQDASGNNVLQVDTSNYLVTVSGTSSSFGSLTLTNAHFKSTQTTAPTIGTPTNCGTSPSSAIAANSTDSAGSFRITTGNPIGTTCDTIISFNKSYGSAPKSIVVIAETQDGGTGTAAARQIYVSASATTSFTVKFNNGGTAGAGEIDWFYYWVVQ